MHDDETVDELIRRRVGDASPTLRFEDDAWSWDEHARASAVRAALTPERRRTGPFHGSELTTS